MKDRLIDYFREKCKVNSKEIVNYYLLEWKKSWLIPSLCCLCRKVIVNFNRIITKLKINKDDYEIYFTN